MRPLSFFIVVSTIALAACDPRSDAEPTVEGQDEVAAQPLDPLGADAARERLAARLRAETDARLAQADADLLAGDDALASAAAPTTRSRSRKGARMGGRRGRVGSPLAQR